MAAFWVYALVMGPMSILIGIATATIGFTAWGIVVPLVWIGLGGGKDDGWMYYALFTSIFMDFVNGLVLTIIYAVQEKVHWKKGVYSSTYFSPNKGPCLEYLPVVLR